MSSQDVQTTTKGAQSEGPAGERPTKSAIVNAVNPSCACQFQGILASPEHQLREMKGEFYTPNHRFCPKCRGRGTRDGVDSISEGTGQDGETCWQLDLGAVMREAARPGTASGGDRDKKDGEFS